MNRHTLDGLTATDRTETSTPRLKFKATEAADGAGVKVHYLENKCTSEGKTKITQAHSSRYSDQIRATFSSSFSICLHKLFAHILPCSITD